MKLRNHQVGSVALYGVILLALIVVAGGGWYVMKRHKSSAPTTTATTQSANYLTKSLSSGTNNADLESDLRNVSGSLTQSNQSLQSAGNSLNDQQLTVSDN